MTNSDEVKDETPFARQAVKTVATTVAGASLGVIGGIAIITAAEVLLPVGLCLWAAGCAGGAIGLLLGTINNKK